MDINNQFNILMNSKMSNLKTLASKLIDQDPTTIINENDNTTAGELLGLIEDHLGEYKAAITAVDMAGGWEKFFEKVTTREEIAYSVRARKWSEWAVGINKELKEFHKI